MKKLVLLLLLLSAPAWSQTRLTPKDISRPTTGQASKRVDDCAPIGRTEDGKLVYSMKCENLPVPPPPPQAEAKEAPAIAAEGQTQRGGLFGWSYDRRPKE
jgi:hypothetical protein